MEGGLGTCRRRRFLLDSPVVVQSLTWCRGSTKQPARAWGFWDGDLCPPFQLLGWGTKGKLRSLASPETLTWLHPVGSVNVKTDCGSVDLFLLWLLGSLVPKWSPVGLFFFFFFPYSFVYICTLLILPFRILPFHVTSHLLGKAVGAPHLLIAKVGNVHLPLQFFCKQGAMQKRLAIRCCAMLGCWEKQVWIRRSQTQAVSMG